MEEIWDSMDDDQGAVCVDLGMLGEAQRTIESNAEDGMRRWNDFLALLTARVLWILHVREEFATMDGAL